MKYGGHVHEIFFISKLIVPSHILNACTRWFVR